MPATEDYLYSLPRMHRWFAVSMVVLFLATLLMMYFDHHDEWRDYQRQFFKLDAEKVVAEETQRNAELGGGDPDKGYQAKLGELRAARDQKQAQLDQKA